MKTLSRSDASAEKRLIRIILVPVDFSDCSQAGLTYAVRFAREVGGRIIVLHVADLGPVMMTTGCGQYRSPVYMAAARRLYDGQMRDFLKRVNFNGVRVQSLCVAGYCPAAIYDAAAKEDADLIIISTHGRTGLGRALIGSVAEGTVRNAACPVLVVPSSKRAQRSSAKESSAQSHNQKERAGCGKEQILSDQNKTMAKFSRNCRNKSCDIGGAT